MALNIVRNDITNMSVDAIVNTTNPTAEVGYGVDLAIHNKAGAQLLAARKLLGKIELGSAAITEGFQLPAKHVIHTVCPMWIDGNHSEAQVLSACYKNSLSVALAHGCRSVAFPLLSAGNLGFPKKTALHIAVSTINEFLMDCDLEVYLVVFSRDTVGLSEKLFRDVKSYIDETYVEHVVREEYALPCGAPVLLDELQQNEYELIRDFGRNDLDFYAAESISLEAPCAKAAMPMEDLEQLLNNTDAGFSETLLELIARSGKKNSDVYNKANIDRKLFSKIKNNPNYTPKKSTVLAFAIALELNLEDTELLLERAGYALSHASKFDIIVEYFIRQKNYDIFLINDVLYEFDQHLLGVE